MPAMKTRYCRDWGREQDKDMLKDASSVTYFLQIGLHAKVSRSNLNRIASWGPCVQHMTCTGDFIFRLQQ